MIRYVVSLYFENIQTVENQLEIKQLHFTPFHKGLWAYFHAFKFYFRQTKVSVSNVSCWLAMDFQSYFANRKQYAELTGLVFGHVSLRLRFPRKRKKKMEKKKKKALTAFLSYSLKRLGTWLHYVSNPHTDKVFWLLPQIFLCPTWRFPSPWHQIFRLLDVLFPLMSHYGKKDITLCRKRNHYLILAIFTYQQTLQPSKPWEASFSPRMLWESVKPFTKIQVDNINSPSPYY